MAGAVARPQDVLLAYQPGRFEGEDDQAYPFEIQGGASYYHELSGEPDDHYDDFSDALRGYLAAYGDGDYTGGRGLYGGRGADPSALVMGVDFSDDSASSGGEEAPAGAGEGAPAGDGEGGPGLLAHVVPTSSEPGVGEPLLAHVVAVPGSEESLAAHAVEAPEGPGGLGPHIVAAPPAPPAAVEGDEEPPRDISAPSATAAPGAPPGDGHGAAPPESDGAPSGEEDEGFVVVKAKPLEGKTDPSGPSAP